MKQIDIISSGKPEEKDILTAREAGELLGFRPETVKKLARQGNIPGQKIGESSHGHWRFSRRQLLRFIEGKYFS